MAAAHDRVRPSQGLRIGQRSGAELFSLNPGTHLLSSGGLDDENTITDPEKIVPEESTAATAGPAIEFAFSPYSLTILQIPLKLRSQSDHHAAIRDGGRGYRAGL